MFHRECSFSLPPWPQVCTEVLVHVLLGNLNTIWFFRAPRDRMPYIEAFQASIILQQDIPQCSRRELVPSMNSEVWWSAWGSPSSKQRMQENGPFHGLRCTVGACRIFAKATGARFSRDDSSGVLSFSLALNSDLHKSIGPCRHII